MVEIIRINPEYKGEAPKPKLTELDEDLALFDKKLEAKKKYESEKASTVLSEEQFIKFYVLKELSEPLRNECSPNMYNEYKTQLENKTLEELTKILDKTKLKVFFSRPTWTLAFISVLKKKEKK